MLSHQMPKGITVQEGQSFSTIFRKINLIAESNLALAKEHFDQAYLSIIPFLENTDPDKALKPKMNQLTMDWCSTLEEIEKFIRTWRKNNPGQGEPKTPSEYNALFKYSSQQLDSLLIHYRPKISLALKKFTSQNRYFLERTVLTVANIQQEAVQAIKQFLKGNKDLNELKPYEGVCLANKELSMIYTSLFVREKLEAIVEHAKSTVKYWLNIPIFDYGFDAELRVKTARAILDMMDTGEEYEIFAEDKKFVGVRAVLLEDPELSTLYQAARFFVRGQRDWSQSEEMIFQPVEKSLKM